MSILWLNDEDVKSLLTPEMARAAVKRVLGLHTDGLCQQPLKPYLWPQGREHETEGGRFISMPAYLGGNAPAAGLKFIAGFPGNVSKGLPRASGIMILSSTVDGRPLALMECGCLSATRTGAVATVAVSLLSPSSAKSAGILGAGPIARATVEALANDHSALEEVVIFDVIKGRATDLVQDLQPHCSFHLVTAETARECIWGRPIVITATTATRSYIEPEWVERTQLIVALSLEDFTEDTFLKADKVIVDDFDQCNREEKLLHRLMRSGRFTRERIHAELGQVLSGTAPGRQRDDELIYVNPMGMAIEDVAVAAAVYDAAVASGKGLYLS